MKLCGLERKNVKREGGGEWEETQLKGKEGQVLHVLHHRNTWACKELLNHCEAQMPEKQSEQGSDWRRPQLRHLCIIRFCGTTIECAIKRDREQSQYISHCLVQSRGLRRHSSRLTSKTSLPERGRVCTWLTLCLKRPLSLHFLSSRASFLCDWEGSFISPCTARDSLSSMISVETQRLEAGVTIILGSKKVLCMGQQHTWGNWHIPNGWVVRDRDRKEMRAVKHTWLSLFTPRGAPDSSGPLPNALNQSLHKQCRTWTATEPWQMDRAQSFWPYCLNHLSIKSDLIVHAVVAASTRPWVCLYHFVVYGVSQKPQGDLTA